VDVNTPDDWGYTALHWACRFGNDLTVDFLLKNSADPFRADISGYRPLEIAVTWAHAHIVELLLNRGVDANQTNQIDPGYTPLHEAAARGYHDIVDLLLRRGARVNAKDVNAGRLPLHWAVQEGHLETAKRLIDHGSDIDAPCDVGFTPVMMAVGEGNYALTELLLRRGANVNARNSLDGGGTALHKAAAYNLARIAELLLGFGADRQVVDDEGRTPLQLAQSYGNGDVGAVLSAGA
jgi:ankyrin repeat protein